MLGLEDNKVYILGRDSKTLKKGAKLIYSEKETSFWGDPIFKDQIGRLKRYSIDRLFIFKEYCIICNNFGCITTS